MVVKRIVSNILADETKEISKFYADLFSLDIVMDQGWIATLASGETAPVQISIGSEGGSGAPFPNISVEVDDIDAVLARAQSMSAEIVYPMTVEPWGVRRFMVSDPVGTVINVLEHV